MDLIDGHPFYTTGLLDWILMPTKYGSDWCQDLALNPSEAALKLYRDVYYQKMLAHNNISGNICANPLHIKFLEQNIDITNNWWGVYFNNKAIHLIENNFENIKKGNLLSDEGKHYWFEFDTGAMYNLQRNTNPKAKELYEKFYNKQYVPRDLYGNDISVHVCHPSVAHMHLAGDGDVREWAQTYPKNPELLTRNIASLKERYNEIGTDELKISDYMYQIYHNPAIFEIKSYNYAVIRDTYAALHAELIAVMSTLS